MAKTQAPGKMTVDEHEKLINANLATEREIAEKREFLQEARAYYVDAVDQAATLQRADALAAESKLVDAQLADAQRQLDTVQASGLIDVKARMREMLLAEGAPGDSGADSPDAPRLVDGKIVGLLSDKDESASVKTDDSTDDEPGDYEVRTVVQLQELLAAKGLEADGKKAELVARLKAADSAKGK